MFWIFSEWSVVRLLIWLGLAVLYIYMFHLLFPVILAGLVFEKENKLREIMRMVRSWKKHHTLIGLCVRDCVCILYNYISIIVVYLQTNKWKFCEILTSLYSFNNSQMGLKTFVYWLVTYIFYYLMYLIATFLVIGVASIMGTHSQQIDFIDLLTFWLIVGFCLGFRFFVYNSFFCVFFLFFIWGHTMLATAFFLSVFFTSSRTATGLTFSHHTINTKQNKTKQKKQTHSEAHTILNFGFDCCVDLFFFLSCWIYLRVCHGTLLVSINSTVFWFFGYTSRNHFLYLYCSTVCVLQVHFIRSIQIFIL